MASQAKRDNQHKPQMGRILQFPKAIELLARVKEYGAAKYGNDNFKLGGKPDSEYIDAAMRHQLAFLSGEVYADDSKATHLGHWLWNVLALIELNHGDLEATDEGFREACDAAEAKRLQDEKTAEGVKAFTDMVDRAILGRAHEFLLMTDDELAS